MGLIKQLIELKGAGVPLTASELFGMWLRKSLTDDLVSAMLVNHVAGLDWPPDLLEAHALAGGRLHALVSAAVSLAKLGASYDRERLLAADLAGKPVLELVHVFADLRPTYAEALTFDELLTRAVEGEDVVAAAKTGRFVPRAQQEGWIVRIEHGPMSGRDLSALIGRGDLPPTTRVHDPERGDWISLDRAKERLGRDRDA